MLRYNVALLFVISGKTGSSAICPMTYLHSAGWQMYIRQYGFAVSSLTPFD